MRVSKRLNPSVRGFITVMMRPVIARWRGVTSKNAGCSAFRLESTSLYHNSQFWRHCPAGYGLWSAFPIPYSRRRWLVTGFRFVNAVGKQLCGLDKLAHLIGQLL